MGVEYSFFQRKMSSPTEGIESIVPKNLIQVVTSNCDPNDPFWPPIGGQKGLISPTLEDFGQTFFAFLIKRYNSKFWLWSKTNALRSHFANMRAHSPWKLFIPCYPCRTRLDEQDLSKVYCIFISFFFIYLYRVIPSNARRCGFTEWALFGLTLRSLL